MITRIFINLSFKGAKFPSNKNDLLKRQNIHFGYAHVY